MEFVVLLLLFGVVAYRLNRRLKAQAREIAELRGVIARLAEGLPPTADTTGADVAAATAVAPMVADTLPAAEPEPEQVIQPPPEPLPPSAPGRSRWRDLEESLASRWLTWLGGGAVALAAAFFIKLSVDYGWVGPGVRVTLGELGGLGLMIGGEWLRRRPAQRAIAAMRPDHVPPALTAAGLFVAFASLYGGYALFHLFDPLVAFAGLTALSLLGIALSLLQGPFIAALGLLAGYVTPLLIASDDPSAWGLFAYLLALNGAGTAVVLYRRWRWLGWGALAGAALWPLLWLIASFGSDDALPTGLYLLLTTALFLMPAALGVADAEAPAVDPPSGDGWRAMVPAWILPRRRHPADRLAVTATALFGLLVAALSWSDQHGGASLTALAAFAALAIAVGWRRERIAIVAWIAGGTVLLALAPWDLPGVAPLPAALDAAGQPVVVAQPLDYPGEVLRFLWTGAGFALLFGAGGFAALWRARRAALWASLSALVPLALLTLAYAHVEPPQIEVDLPAVGWPAAALVLAALLVGATTGLARHRHRPGVTLGMAAYAAGAVGAITLGATMTLREAWLTVALAAQVPVLAWLERRLGLRELRGIALLVAVAVLVRLAVNPYVLDYQGYGWIAYGYGLPALGFLLAARWMRESESGPSGANDPVVMVLEAGALIFITAMLALAVHRWTTGGLTEAPSTLVEVSLHSLCWLGLALFLAVERRWRSRPVAVWGRRILAGLAAVTVISLQLLVLNPLWTDEAVGQWPVVNHLLLAYGAPALLGAAFLRLDPPPAGVARVAAPILILLLIAAELALEIRRAFQGPVLSGSMMSNAEWYGYSAGFLLFAVMILVLALRFGWGWMRHAGMALLLAVVAKVFLSDMQVLEGMFRVVSFLGLGGCLIGIGYLYQRLLRPPAPLSDGGPGGAPLADDLLDQRTH